MALSVHKWDIFQAPSWMAGAGEYRLIAAGTRLVLLRTGDVGPAADARRDKRPDGYFYPLHGPAGAMLDENGQWHRLPEDPFAAEEHPAHDAQAGKGWARDGVWTGGQLIMTGRVVRYGQAVKHVETAALDLNTVDRPGAVWKHLVPVEGDDPRLDQALPVGIDGRVVWPSLVYDPTTGKSVPASGSVRFRNKGTENLAGGTLFGNLVWFGGALLDPVTGHTYSFPQPPGPRGGHMYWAGASARCIRRRGRRS